ncbi:hypothetical protein DL240_15050 [Lujinxingia litoralis]|uniref:phosphomevalonate kinase n=1 Tax=Lujinxingia litoralis TaxID=2211119 RepID=A0A328C2V3_9DELT|nr:hypothetical protein [Lujinxingia litoralis]RAL20985.1 hypothetical protein DL240_15050 [Lujinxingia litoralis]
MTTAVRAPSKLFLFGEYAVLAGGRSLVVATERAVQASLHPEQTSYRVEGAALSSALALPRAALAALGRPDDASTLARLRLDVRELYERNQKLGLGSSAASTVAIIKALAPELTPAQTFEIAHRAHRNLQGGKGSGADVAASAFGGTLSYRLTRAQLPDPGAHLSVAPRDGEHLIADAAILAGLTLPDDLGLIAVWTGAPASSVSFIRGLNAALAHNLPLIAATLKSIATQAERALDATLNNDTHRWLDAFQQADHAMETLGAHCDLPIITPAHRALREQALNLGAYAKPSGAGGGDFSLVAWHREQATPRALFQDRITLALNE